MSDLILRLRNRNEEIFAIGPLLDEAADMIDALRWPLRKINAEAQSGESILLMAKARAAVGHWDMATEKWAIEADGRYGGEFREPTHWMPLPEIVS